MPTTFCQVSAGSKNSHWFTAIFNWLAKNLVPLFHQIRCKTKTNRDWLSLVFPPFVLDCGQSLFSSKDRETIKGVSVTVTTSASWHYVTLTVTLACLFVLRSFPLIFEEKRNCSQPSFASATSNYFEFWLAHCIVWVLCDLLRELLWFWFYDTYLKTALFILLAAMITKFRPLSLDSSAPAF